MTTCSENVVSLLAQHGVTHNRAELRNVLALVGHEQKHRRHRFGYYVRGVGSVVRASALHDSQSARFAEGRRLDSCTPQFFF